MGVTVKNCGNTVEISKILCGTWRNCVNNMMTA